MGLPPPRHWVAVLLAGGESRRMGLPKALLDVGGETFLARLYRVFGEAGCDVVVVVGADAAAIRASAQHLRFVDNAGWASGQWSSVRVGLRAALDAGAEGVLIHPVDVPLVSVHTVSLLRAAVGEGTQAIIPVVSGAPGHPVALSSAAAARVLADVASPHLEAALQRLAVQRCEVSDLGALQEADTPEEYRALFGKNPRLA